MIAPDALTGGFADPALQSQAVFRKALDAFARPGTIVTIPSVVSAPAPLYASSAALVCALADEGTPIHFDHESAQGSAPAWVGFHTGAPVTDLPGAAHFAVVTDLGKLPPFEEFPQGSQEYPDRSATIILHVKDFAGRMTVWLEGPGIDGAIGISPDPLPENFVESMRRNRSLFPRGVDLVLASPDAIIALPRSVRVNASQES